MSGDRTCDSTPKPPLVLLSCDSSLPTKGTSEAFLYSFITYIYIPRYLSYSSFLNFFKIEFNCMLLFCVLLLWLSIQQYSPLGFETHACCCMRLTFALYSSILALRSVIQSFCCWQTQCCFQLGVMLNSAALNARIGFLWQTCRSVSWV